MIVKALPVNVWVTGLLVLVLLGYAACAPVAAAPIPGPEFGIAGVSTSARYNQEYVDVCAGNGVYLAVWQDRRSGQNYDIYGMLLGPDGSPVGTESFLISRMPGGAAAANDQIYPTVGFNGTSFLVAWADRRAANLVYRIYATRVTTTGQVLDEGGLPLPTASTPTDQFVPKIASNGTNWVVVWQEKGSTGSDDIYSTSVSSAGTVGSRVAIAYQISNEQWPSIAWNGTNYLVVWQDYRNAESTGTDIYGCRLSSLGQKVASSEKLISTAAGSTSAGAAGAQTVPSVAASSIGMWLVVWQDKRGATDCIYCARMSSAGLVQDLGGVSVATATDSLEEPSVAWNGTHFLAAWRDRSAARSVRAARINTSAGILDPTSISITSSSAGQYGPAVAGSNGSCLVAWYSLDMSDSNIFGAQVNSTGQVSPLVQWSVCLQDQPQFSAAFDGTNYVVVWSDRRSGAYRIYAARIAPDGTVLDPGGVRVTAEPVGEETQPAIAWNGTHFLVVWTEMGSVFTDIKGVRITPTLTRVDTSPFAISNADLDQHSPAVAWNGTSFLVVWVDYRNAVAPNYYSDIRGARWTAAGVVSQISAAVSAVEGFQFAPTVASCGGSFMVAWEDYRTNDTPVVYCSRVTGTGIGTGTVQDPSGIQVPAVPYYNTQPKVASDGTNYFVIWTDKREGWSNDNIYGVRMSTAAARLDAADIPICGSIKAQIAPSVAWNGQNYLVAWRDGRNRSVSGDDIYLRGVTPDGALVGASDSLIAGDSQSELNPAVVTSGPSLGMVFYSNFMNETHRTAGRVISEPPPVPVVSDDGAYSTSAGSLHAVWSAAPRQSEVAEYRYAIGTTAGGADVVGWTSAGLQTQVTHTGLSLSDGASYFISVQTRNSTGMWSDPGMSDGITVDASAPTTPTVADDGDYAQSNSLHASWSSADPHTGVLEYRYAVGTSAGATDVLDWTSAGTIAEVTTAALPIADGATCYFSVQARNAAGLWSEVASSNGIVVDTSAPTTPVVTDDGDYTPPGDLHAAWSSSDPHTGVLEYRYAVGTSAGGNDIVDWRSVGTSAEVTETGLTLTPGTAYFFSVQARNEVGLWSSVGSSDGISVISEPPTTPVVTDDGDYTLPDMLHATWTAEDIYTGIAEYSYAIGTSVGGNDIIDWTSTGTTAEVTHTGLSLSEGVTYYISVKARNGADLWSEIGSSNGISVPPAVDTIIAAKFIPNDTAMRLTGKIVTAGTTSLPTLPGTSYFYIQDSNKLAGIKVVSSTDIATGSLIDVAGKIETINGERQITASAVKVVSTDNALPRPINMADRALGGVALNEYTPGVHGERGPNNIGLFIKTWGNVTYAGGEGEDFFYVNSGSFVDDGSGHLGVKVYCGRLTKPAMGSTVVVTGISSCEPLSERLVRRVLATQIVEYPH